MTIFLLNILSRLPFWILYLLSDMLAPLAFHVYRKKVVLKNITKVFPEKSEEARVRIAKGFYRNMLDLAIESIKLSSISADQLRKRIQFVDNEALNEIKSTSSPLLMYTTHMANWEYMSAITQLELNQAVPIYKPLKNKGNRCICVADEKSFLAPHQSQLMRC